MALAIELRRQFLALVGGSSGTEVPSNSSDAQYWLDRAEQAWLQAEEMTHPPAKRVMLLIAAGYQRLAQHAQERSAGKKARRE